MGGGTWTWNNNPIQKAVDTTINNAERLGKKADDEARDLEKRSGVSVNVPSQSTSKKFGEGGEKSSTPPTLSPVEGPGFVKDDPRNLDPYTGRPYGSNIPQVGGQLNFGESNPAPGFLPTPTPPPQNAFPFDALYEPTPAPYSQQVKRLRYRKYSKDLGL